MGRGCVDRHGHWMILMLCGLFSAQQQQQQQMQANNQFQLRHLLQVEGCLLGFICN